MKIREYFSKTSNIITFFFLLLICVLGFVLRIRNLDYLSLWGDDGHTFIGTVSILKHGYPLLPSGHILWHGIFDYYLKALPALFFGAGEFSLRIVSVLCGTGTILATYFFGKELANKFVGFLSAFIIAFSTWYVQFSREARYYQDYQFFYILTFLFFYLGFVKDRKPYRVISVIFMVLTPLVHGVGIVLILLFILLIFYKGKKFFKKEIIIPFIIVFVLDAAQIINQVFFWKVGRSFYAEGTGMRAMIDAYFQMPDPYYFNAIRAMFPRMFYVFIAGILFFIVFTIIISVKKHAAEDNYPIKENYIKWGRLKWPYNYFLILSNFILVTIFISLGKMYGQQRYVYFLMPVFIIGFSYSIFLFSLFLKKIITKLTKVKSLKVHAVILIVIFIFSSAALINGINPREVLSLPYKAHNEKINNFYSISNSWSVHWDAATAGKYVAANALEDDIIITTDIYNSPPYTGRVDYWLWTGNLASWAPYHNENGRIIDDTYGVEVLRNPMAFISLLNENTGKNIWVLTSRSLFTKEHVDPLILNILEGLSRFQVLTARDDTSRLYFFPATSREGRILLSDIFKSENSHIINLNEDGKIFFDFTNKAAEKYLVYGFSHVEENNGTWATGQISVLFLNIDDKDADYKISINSKPLDNGKNRQRMSIRINDEKISDYKYDNISEFKRIELILKGELLKEGLNILTFDYKYSTTPEELGISNDSRTLSVFFKSMEIEKL
ncbi:MAG: glycosyltransferase family 39 protein [Actinomycetota bacterium]|nr:glycosyltransferase family 39 protein [Actinomycetota bacterium]